MKSNTQNTPNYYAVIPANVRYCKDLEPSAKLLYGEISALCNQEGYCWANNRYLADLYGVNIRTIQNWLASLVKNNFIKMVSHEENDNFQRHIYLAHTVQIIPTRKKCQGGVKKMTGGYEKNAVHNTTSNTTSNNPPLSSPPQKPVPKKSLRSEEEEISIFDFLEGTKLSPKDKKRLSKDYSREQVLRAIKISETQKIKKTLMGLLLNILDNPDSWPDAAETQLETHQQRIASEYNETLRKSRNPVYELLMKPGAKSKQPWNPEDVAKLNDASIKDNYMNIILHGIITRVSLKSSDFEQDIKDAIAQLR